MLHMLDDVSHDSVKYFNTIIALFVHCNVHHFTYHPALLPCIFVKCLVTEQVSALVVTLNALCTQSLDSIILY